MDFWGTSKMGQPIQPIWLHFFALFISPQKTSCDFTVRKNKLPLHLFLTNVQTMVLIVRVTGSSVVPAKAAGMQTR